MSENLLCLCPEILAEIPNVIIIDLDFKYCPDYYTLRMSENGHYGRTG